MSRANINVPAWGSIYGQPDESCRPVTWKIPIGYCDEMGSACAQAARQTLILERDLEQGCELPWSCFGNGRIGVSARCALERCK